MWCRSAHDQERLVSKKNLARRSGPRAIHGNRAHARSARRSRPDPNWRYQETDRRAFGSRWVANEFIRNTGSTPVDYIRPSCPTAFCGFTFRPGETVESLDDPFGLFFISGSADQVRFFSVVRDISRQNESWGAEIRAVRERELQQDRIELIRVPTDPAFRRNLRLYTVRTTTEVNEVSVLRVRAYDGAEDLALRERLLGEREFMLDSRKGPEPDYVGYEFVGNIDDLFAGTKTDAIRLVIERVSGTAKLWAFVTLTNNETHHVTTVTP
jgi:hypothetical protein